MRASLLIAMVALAALAQQSAAAKCSEQTFQRAVQNLNKHRPNKRVALKCQRAVYNKLCGRCGNDVGCYWRYGLFACAYLRSPRRQHGLFNWYDSADEEVGGRRWGNFDWYDSADEEVGGRSGVSGGSGGFDWYDSADEEVGAYTPWCSRCYR